MVHHSSLVLNEEQRKVLESGGGTAETTRAVRATIGKNFEEYCDAREEEWCKSPENAPDWWSNADGNPRKVNELVSDQNVISVANFVSVLNGQNHSNFANLSVGV